MLSWRIETWTKRVYPLFTLVASLASLHVIIQALTLPLRFYGQKGTPIFRLWKPWPMCYRNTGNLKDITLGGRGQTSPNFITSCLPIPGKILRFPEELCFSPETALLRLAPPPPLPLHTAQYTYLSNCVLNIQERGTHYRIWKKKTPSDQYSAARNK